MRPKEPMGMAMLCGPKMMAMQEARILVLEHLQILVTKHAVLSHESLTSQLALSVLTGIYEFSPILYPSVNYRACSRIMLKTACMHNV
jgi:hypothetical protein